MSIRTNEAGDTWDVIVIGGGSAGENAAQYAIQGSERTAVIVEAELVGGECSYWACMPSKALLRPVELARRRRGRSPAWPRCSTGSLDLEAILARRDRFTHDHDDSGQVEWATGAGIDVVRGRGPAGRREGGRGHRRTTAPPARCRRATPSSSPPARPRRSRRSTACARPAVDLARRHQPPRGARAGRRDRRRGRGLRVGHLAARARRPRRSR